jgi:hypothetical protein
MDLNSAKNKALLEAEDTKLLSRFIKDGFKLDFACTNDTMDLLHLMYEPHRIINGTGIATDHPLAAAHQRIAQIEAYQYAKQHRPIIEIGPNATNFMKISAGTRDSHGCTIKSARDQIRHGVSAASSTVRGCRDSNYFNDVLLLANAIPTRRFCVNGFQNCGFQANHAIAVHSLYDVDFDMLAQGMDNHGITNINAWMHFPLEALDTDEWTNEQDRYHFRVTKKYKDKNGNDHGKTIHFNFLQDASFGYQHNYDTWMNYMKIGGIDTPYGFSMVIEKKRHNGSQWKLSVSRASLSGTFYYRIPSAMKHLCRVPDFQKMAQNNMCKYQDIVYFNCDVEKVKKIYFFMLARVEKGFSLDTAKAYARTLIHEVRFDKRIVERHWEITAEEWTKLCTAIFLLALIQRRREDKTCSMAIKKLNALDRKKTWFERQCNEIAEMFGELWDDMWWKSGEEHKCQKKTTTALMHGETKNIMSRACVEFYQDIVVEDYVHDYETTKELVIAPLPPVITDKTFEDITGENDTRKEYLALLASQLGQDSDGQTNQPWANIFGLQAKLPKSDLPRDKLLEYQSQSQHQIMVDEIKKQIETLEERASPDEKGLLVVLTGAHRAFITRSPKALHVENMAMLRGVPGSGKTTEVLEQIVPAFRIANPEAKLLVLTPTNALAAHYTRRLPCDGNAATNIKAMTAHKGISMLKDFKPELVILDEAYLFPTAYINFIAEHHKVILLGDPCQINHVDFESNWHGCTKIRDLTEHIPTRELMVSRRCPVDVIGTKIIASAYPGITTTSTVGVSIEHVHNKFKKENATVLSFTNEVCQDLEKNNKELGTTVHRVQGETFNNVILHYTGSPGEFSLLKNNPEHLVVALTRHKSKLYIRDVSKNGDLTTFMNDSFPLTTYAEVANVNPASMDIQEMPTNVAQQEVVISQRDDAEYPTTGANEQEAEKILQNIFPIQPMEEYQSAITTELRPGEDAKGTLRLSELGKDETAESKTKKIHKFVAGQRVKITRVQDQRMACKTMIERLTKKTKNLNAVAAKREAKRLFNPVASHFDFSVTQSDRDQVFLQATTKFQERGHTTDDIHDQATWTERNANLVKNHLKTQQKPSTSADPLRKDKAGQGISAWSKDLNMQMMCYTRLLEYVLTKKGDGKIKIMTGRSDDEIMAELEMDRMPNDKCVENDWTEFDSSQNNITREILKLALKAVGCPKVLLSDFMAMLQNRKICDSFLSLTVNDKKDSGAPHTLIDNCLFNMCICNDIIKGYRTLYIKGDDSYANGRDVHFDFNRINQYEKNEGFKLKAIESESGSFVSFLINQQGVAYDIPRIAAKVLTRDYINKEDYNDYRTAIGVTLRDAKRERGLNMVLVNAMHYRRSEAEMDVLFSFLKNFATGEIPFSRTIEMMPLTRIVDRPIDLGPGELLTQQKKKTIAMGSAFFSDRRKAARRAMDKRETAKLQIFNMKEEDSERKQSKYFSPSF